MGADARVAASQVEAGGAAGVVVGGMTEREGVSLVARGSGAAGGWGAGSAALDEGGAGDGAGLSVCAGCGVSRLE